MYVCASVYIYIYIYILGEEALAINLDFNAQAADLALNLTAQRSEVLNQDNKDCATCYNCNLGNLTSLSSSGVIQNL